MQNKANSMQNQSFFHCAMKTFVFLQKKVSHFCTAMYLLGDFIEVEADDDMY
jgi:hypothetical protein